jgi:hypothetical protein
MGFRTLLPFLLSLRVINRWVKPTRKHEPQTRQNIEPNGLNAYLVPAVFPAKNPGNL